MASLGINKCDRCGVEIRVEYGVSYGWLLILVVLVFILAGFITVLVNRR